MLNRLPALAAGLLLALAAVGCLSLHAPLGPTPGRLEIKVTGRVDQAMINQAVFQQVGSLMDQPTLGHWLGPPTWQVSAFLLGPAKAIWPLKPLSGLAKPHQGMSASGRAVFEVPSGANRFRLTWACTVTHYWSEGVSTWQEPVGIYLSQRVMTLTIPPNGVLTIDPFKGPPPK